MIKIEKTNDMISVQAEGTLGECLDELACGIAHVIRERSDPYEAKWTLIRHLSQDNFLEDYAKV